MSLQLSVSGWVGVAAVIVALTGLYGLIFGYLSLFQSRIAAGFLSAFASSPGKHVLELTLRLLIGMALVQASPIMLGSGLWAAFGWVLCGTSTILLCLPWRIHARFARWSVPRALPYLDLIGWCSLVLVLALIFSLVLGWGARAIAPSA